MTELRLVQDGRDLEYELQTFDAGVDVDALDAEFVNVAKSAKASATPPGERSECRSHPAAAGIPSYPPVATGCVETRK